MSADNFFGASVKSASFDGPIGTSWAGVITHVADKEVQATEYSPNGGVGAKKFYPSGDPVMELPITIRTDVRDPSNPQDDGRRVIYFGGEKRQAMKAALRAAGIAGGPVEGDWFSLTYSGNGGADGKRKLYTAQYAINPNRGAGGFFQAEQPAPAAPPAPVQAAPSWGQQVAQAGPPPAFAGQVTLPAAPASPFAPAAPAPAPWPPAQDRTAATAVQALAGVPVAGAAPVTAESFAAAATNPAAFNQPEQGQPIAAGRPWA